MTAAAADHYPGLPRYGGQVTPFALSCPIPGKPSRIRAHAFWLLRHWLVATISLRLRAAGLRLGIGPNHSPRLINRKPETAAGFTVDLLRPIAADPQLNLEFFTKRWAAIHDDFRAGQIDLLEACGKDPECAPGMRFSVPTSISQGRICQFSAPHPQPAKPADLATVPMGPSRPASAKPMRNARAGCASGFVAPSPKRWPRWIAVNAPSSSRTALSRRTPSACETISMSSRRISRRRDSTRSCTGRSIPPPRRCSIA